MLSSQCHKTGCDLADLEMDSFSHRYLGIHKMSAVGSTTVKLWRYVLTNFR